MHKLIKLSLLTGLGILLPSLSPAQGVEADDGPGIAAAMRAHRSSADTVLLDQVTSPARDLRDNDIFQAALEIGGDATASPEARVYAFRSLIVQLRPGLEMSFGQLASASQRAEGCLGSGVPIHGPPTLLGAALPSDAAQRVGELGARIAADASQPQAVRSAAVCARSYQSVASPLPDRPYKPLIQVEKITVAYVCGNTFKARNPFGIEVEVIYEVEGTPESGVLILPASSGVSEISFTATNAGNVRLVENFAGGEVLATGTHGNTPCP